jgi:hypothetical protein
MNVVELQKKLIAVAKSSPPSDSVPYAFEQRIMAHLRSARVVDNWGTWAIGLWRASVPCVALMVGLSIWSVVTPDNTTNASPSVNTDISQQIERTVLAAAVEQEQVTDSTW